MKKQSPKKQNLKKAVLATILLTIMMLPAMAANITLAWDAPTDGNVTGYKIHMGSSMRNYSSSINVGNRLSCQINGLNAGTFYFAVTAYDSQGNESAFSEEVFTSVTVTSTSSSSTSSSSTTTSSSSTSSTTVRSTTTTIPLNPAMQKSYLVYLPLVNNGR